MKILIIVGSARKRGYSYEISQNLKDQILNVSPSSKVDIFNISEKKISPCLGCVKCCDNTNQYCIYNDDVYEAYKLMEECDNIVYISPIYECFISGILKNFFDRTNHYTSFFKLAGKPMNLILSGVQPLEGSTKEFSNKHVVKNINDYFKNYANITHTHYKFLGFIQHKDHHTIKLEQSPELNKLFNNMAKTLLKQKVNQKTIEKSKTPYNV